MRRTLKTVAAAVILWAGALYLSPVATAADNGSTSVTPAHAIACTSKANVPSKSGGAVVGDAYFYCSSAPDVCDYYTELQIWDPVGRSWYRAARNEFSSCSFIATGPHIHAIYDCSSPYYPFQFRTKAHYELFHGNWTTVDRYSSAITLSC